MSSYVPNEDPDSIDRLKLSLSTKKKLAGNKVYLISDICRLEE